MCDLKKIEILSDFIFNIFSCRSNIYGRHFLVHFYKIKRLIDYSKTFFFLLEKFAHS